MVSAAVAAFFYLRVGITMYSPVGLVADPVAGEVDSAVSAGSGGDDLDARAGSLSGPDGAQDVGPADGLAHQSGEVERVSLALMTDAPAEADVATRVVKVPGLTWVAITICAAFTVVFGIIPEPIIDFAHQATLLFVS
jgi:hypothetical protein